MRPGYLTVDPRHFQLLFQSFFLAYGLLVLDWKADWPHYLVSIGAACSFNIPPNACDKKACTRFGESAVQHKLPG